MATKNSLCLQLAVSLVLTSNISCRTSPERASPKGSHPAPVVQGQVNQPPMAPPPPEMEERTQPLKIGLFFGPGGIRSFAHIGILKVFQRNNIPIEVVGGMEWGALVAGIYSQSRSSNDVEWQLGKLKKDVLPNRSLLRSGLSPADIKELNPFLMQVFASKTFDSAAVKFSCPTTDGESTSFVERGAAVTELPKCVALPPLFEGYFLNGRTWMSGLVSTSDWGTALRKQGAQFIVYVDVISKGRFADAAYRPESYAKAFSTSLRSLSRTHQLQANYVIEVPMDIDMSDFDRRREAIAVGERVGQNFIKDILSSAGY